MTKPVGPDEQQGTAARAKVDHRIGGVQQLFGRQGEQLRARDGLDDVEASTGRGGSGRPGTLLQRLLDPPGDQGNIQNVRVHRRDGEQADEAVLDDVLADASRTTTM